MPEQRESSGTQQFSAAWQKMPEWQRAMLFIVGLLMMAVGPAWLFFFDAGHEHGILEWGGAGVCTFLGFVAAVASRTLKGAQSILGTVFGWVLKLRKGGTNG